MPLSRYPHGFNDGVLLREHLHVDAVPGKIFYVGNNATLLVGERGASDANDGSFLKPFSTVDYAISQCAANRGDVIFIRPNHTTTVDAADEVDFDVAGISVIGLGNGSNRPRFDYTAGAGEVAIGADNVLLQNINFHANVDSVLIAIDVEDGVDNAVIRGCLFDVETAGTDEFDNAIRFTNNNTNCIVEDCDFDMGIADAVRAIFLDADTQGMIIRNNRIRGDYSTACIGGDTTLSTDILIENNLLINGEAGDIGTVECIELLTGTHGVIRDNHLVCNVATPDLAIVADTCFQFNNYYSETVNAEAVHVNDPALVDSASNAIGVDDSNNVFASSNVVANRDGSLLERSEFQMNQVTQGLAVASVDLSAASPRTIYTITGGPILIHFLGIKITAACSANAALINFNSVPTVGSPTVISKVACAPDLQSAAAGDWFAIGGGSAEVAIKYATGSVLPDIQSGVSGGIVVDAGTITVVMSTDNLTTGTATAYMAYTPLSSGVTVA